MSIVPLPQFEADLAEQRERDRAEHSKLPAPETLVVRFGAMRLIGEYRYLDNIKPGCGSKIYLKTHRGHEIGEVLTSTCPNAGCSKSITRQQMLEYIENSGGLDYPFFEDGRAIRIATVEELQQQSAIEQAEPEARKRAQAIVNQFGHDMKLVKVEHILGGETLTIYYTAEHRIDFRDMLTPLRDEFGTRVELRQIGARDEARLVADYERCGQHCCCKQFLKVLKPISMRSAKQQKSTLDPLKISGRCGRLMCCLRYEDESYRDLIKRLPKMRARVGTAEGIGIVVDRQILTQLVLVELDDSRKRIAIPVEELVAPEDVQSILKKAPDPLRGASADAVAKRARRFTSKQQQQDEYREQAESQSAEPTDVDPISDTPTKKKKRRRKKRRRTTEESSASDQSDSQSTQPPAPSSPSQASDTQPTDSSDSAPPTDTPRKKKKKRRRKRKPNTDGPSAGTTDNSSDNPPPGSPGSNPPPPSDPPSGSSSDPN